MEGVGSRLPGADTGSVSVLGAPAARAFSGEAQGSRVTGAGHSGESRPDLGLHASSTVYQQPHPISNVESGKTFLTGSL